MLAHLDGGEGDKDAGGGTEKGGRFGSRMRDGRVAKKGYVFTFPYFCTSPKGAQSGASKGDLQPRKPGAFSAFILIPSPPWTMERVAEGMLHLNQFFMTLKGILFGALAGVVLLGATSASLPHQPASGGLRVGDVLPKMKSMDAENRASTSESSPRRYRLIHFWAAYDATSRAANVVWDHYFAGQAPTAIHYEAISLDPDEAVWSQTISLDQVAQEKPALHRA